MEIKEIIDYIKKSLLDFIKDFIGFFEEKYGVYKMELSLKAYQDISQELESFSERHEFSKFKPSVGVFGENSTGKSTFLNALLGNKNQFEMGFGETTDKVTVLFSSDSPDAIDKSSQEFVQADYDHLNYMDIYDIPGFGQRFSHEKLRTVLQHMNIIFWFINASSGIKEADKHFMDDLKQSDAKVIVIYNKVDAIGDSLEFEAIKKKIQAEIEKIYKLFKKESLSKNLVTVFPFTAMKSLAGSIKGERGAYKAIDKIVQDTLLYAVFVESYRGFSDNILTDNVDYEIDKIKYMKEINKLCQDISDGLERKLKKEISMLDSLNPFSSKDEKAEPIVLKYRGKLREKVNKQLKSLHQEIWGKMKEIKDQLNSFEVFGKTNISINSKKMEPIYLDIDLDDIARSNFTGDSFSESVSEVFLLKTSDDLEEHIPETLERYEKSLTNFMNTAKKNSAIFAEELDHKLDDRAQKVQNLILHILLKAIRNDLNSKDEEVVKKILDT